MRNMFIFFVLAALVYFSYDTLILKPQREAIQQQNKAKAEIAASMTPEQKIALEEASRPKPRTEALVTSGRLNFSNPELRGSINLKGGSIDDASLIEYFETLEKQNNVTVLNPRGAIGQRSVEYGWVAGNGSAVGVPTKETIWRVGGNAELAPGKPVTLIWDNGQGLTFERRLELDELFMFTISQRVINNSGKKVTLYPYGLISQKGLPPGHEGAWVSYEGPVGFIDDSLFNEGYKHIRKNKKDVAISNTGWLGFTQKYWLTALIPPQGQSVKYSYSYAGAEKDRENMGLYQADFLGAPLELQPGQSGEVQSRLFVGAKRVLQIKDYEKGLNIPQFDLSVDFGWFWFMTKPFFYALHYMGLFFGNMGAAIILLTVMLRAAVFPLTNTSYRSFAKMKVVAPLVSEMREKYADDKQKMQEELVQMYQREGVNPMSGCLPILLQIPIFFALYKTFFVTIELRHAPFFGWIKDLSAADPTSVFNLFGLIPWDPPGFLMIGVWPCLMLLAMILQKKLNPPPQDPLQRDLANYMPFLFAFIMSKFAAGLVVYWTFSAFIGVLQQMIIMKSMGVPIHLFGETEKEEAPPSQDKQNDDQEAKSEIDKEDQEHREVKKEISPPKPKKSKKKKK